MANVPKKGAADVWAVFVVCVVQMTCFTCFTTIFDVKQVLQEEERYDTLSLRKHKCVEISASVRGLTLQDGIKIKELHHRMWYCSS